MLAAVTAAFHQVLGPLHTDSITPEETEETGLRQVKGPS